MTNGIYTLANDVVYDQLVALLNSIEVNAGWEIPVCIIPYDDRLDKVRVEVAHRPNVTLFEDAASIAYWEDFVTQAWRTHHRAQKAWQEKGIPEVYRLGMHRKLCGFDGPFDKFVYLDADILLMGSLDSIYEKLDDYDWVTNDFQYKSKIKFVFDSSEAELFKVFPEDKLRSHIFCAGFFASKKGVFNTDNLAHLLEKMKSGEADTMALWWPDQSLFNYMVIASGISYYNFAYHDVTNATGSIWSSQFDIVNQVLYDKGRRLTYLHYMSIPSSNFTQLCQGEDVDIPYQDLFLHYRYLKSLQERPTLTRPSWLVRCQRAANAFAQGKMSNAKHKLASLKKRFAQ